MHARKLEVVDGLFEFREGLLPGGRRPRLWLVNRDGEVHRFQGHPIASVVAVTFTALDRAGKWSVTTYRLRVGTAAPVELLAPLHGQCWPEGTWDEGWAAFSALVPHARRASWEAALRADYPAAAARWDGAAEAPPLE